MHEDVTAAEYVLAPRSGRLHQAPVGGVEDDGAGGGLLGPTRSCGRHTKRNGADQCYLRNLWH
jgi:hypothetical protein